MSVPTDLSKLSNAIKNDVVKKVDYSKLVAKDASGLVKKTDYNLKLLKQKVKFLILVVLLKRLITILKSLK